MAKSADIGSKRLISLDPAAWVRWLTGDPTVEALDFVSGEFEWVSRATDVLIKARSLRQGPSWWPTRSSFVPTTAWPGGCGPTQRWPRSAMG